MAAALKSNLILFERSATENGYLFFSILGFIVETLIAVCFFFNLQTLITVKILPIEYCVCILY